MSSYYDDDIDAGYVRFTDNKIVKTEPISKNMYVDLDKNDKPVGVEILGMKDNIRHNIAGRQIENSLSDLESARFKEFVIDEDIIELKNKFGKF